MGKGDARTKRGKIFRGSFGNTRPQNPRPANAGSASTPAPRTAARPAAAPPPRGRGKR